MIRAGFSLERRLEELERGYIQAALETAGGNLSKAARILDINRTTLYSRLQRLGIPWSE
jgi:two-component system nitrogen regulation response regulator GlnG